MDRHDGDLVRRFERIVAERSESAWVKARDGRFLLASSRFVYKLGIAPSDLGTVRDLDLIARRDVRRFRAEDDRVLASERSTVVIEPPDSLSPDSWFATLKLPVAGREGHSVATLAWSLPLDDLMPLERVRREAWAESPEPPDPDWPLRARDHLDEYFREKLVVPDLARQFGRHPDHLARQFRGLFGVTIARYLRARRVAWAADRLARSEDPLAAVALDAGFADQSHLTRSFREILHTTPARYRRQARRANTSPEPPLRRILIAARAAASQDR